MLLGGLENSTKYYYETVRSDGMGRSCRILLNRIMGAYHPGAITGADVQIKFANRKGFTEIRGEYISGQSKRAPQRARKHQLFCLYCSGRFHLRRFNGAYFYFLQHLFSMKHQFLLKYDWFDPNTKVKGRVKLAWPDLTRAQPTSVLIHWESRIYILC